VIVCPGTGLGSLFSLGGGWAQAWEGLDDDSVEGPLGPPVPGTWVGQP